MRADLTVAETAAALGTSPQTVRALLRTGELRGQKRAWGSRYVWEISQEAVDEFLDEYGRLDGRRRPRPAPPTVVETAAVPGGQPGGAAAADDVADFAPPEEHEE